MNDGEKNQYPILLFIFLLAILLAVVVFLGFTIWRNRTVGGAGLEAAPGGEPAVGDYMVLVNDESIALQVDPNTRPQIVDVASEPPRTEEVPVVEQPPVEQPIIEGQEVPTAVPDPTAPPAEAPAPTAAPVVIPAAEKIIFIDYIVQAGDTLYSIAQREATSIVLMAEYGIASDNLITGTTIRLPVGNPGYCAGNGNPYVVREGDTAFSIGRRFNTTHQVLQQMNNLDAAFTVRVSDIICVP
jgi:LysM repeat protein